MQQLYTQEKQHSQEIIQQARDRFEEQRMSLEQKIHDLTEKWEDKLAEGEKWRERLEKDNESLRNLLGTIKSSGGLDSKKAGNIAKALNEELSNLDSTMKKDIASLSDNLKVLMKELRQINEEKYESKYKYEREKDIAGLEKKFQKQLVEAKNASDLAVENLKASYEQEIAILKVDLFVLNIWN